MFCFNINSILFSGFLLMVLFSLLFFCARYKNHKFNLAFLVAAITSFSYLLMLKGFFVTEFYGQIYYTRWIFYAASCSLLLVSIVDYLKIDKKKLLLLVPINVLVMLTGTVSAAATDHYKWAFFFLSSLFYIFLLLLLFEDYQNNKQYKKILLYIVLGWNMFPVVFLLAPEGFGLICSLKAAVSYLILDVFTKIVFYFDITSKK